jgi:hypothetical protein
MSAALPRRLFDALHQPRGFAALTTVLGALAGLSVYLAPGETSGNWLRILAIVCPALISIMGALGVAVPDRLAGTTRQPTWIIVASLCAMGLFLLAIAISI